MKQGLELEQAESAPPPLAGERWQVAQWLARRGEVVVHSASRPDHPGPFLARPQPDQPSAPPKPAADGRARARYGGCSLAPGSSRRGRCRLLDLAMGSASGRHVVRADPDRGLVRAATRPAGRAVALVPRHWWMRLGGGLASCRRPAAWADPSDQVRGWIDLTGSRSSKRSRAGRHGATLYRVRCRLFHHVAPAPLGLRAVEERLELPGGRAPPLARRRRRVAREPYGRPPQLRAPGPGAAGRLQILKARAHRHRLSLRLKTPRRGLAWPDLAEILRVAGASVPLA